MLQEENSRGNSKKNAFHFPLTLDTCQIIANLIDKHQMFFLSCQHSKWVTMPVRWKLEVYLLSCHNDNFPTCMTSQQVQACVILSPLEGGGTFTLQAFPLDVEVVVEGKERL